MAEQITRKYQGLFAINLLHHYWLDEGIVAFDLIPDSEKKEKRLLSYDMRPFLSVIPTVSTTKALNELGCIYKNTGLGCTVAVSHNTVIPVETMFGFVVTVQNPAIFKYTALTLRPQKIHEIYYPPEDKIYRYKENVPVLSNLTGASRGSGPDKTLFLSTEIPSPTDDDQVESLVLSNGALLQLTGDQPGAGTQQIHSQATDLPVFVHQDDVPQIVPPAGLVGAPARGITLTDDFVDNVFALIRLSPIRADDDDFSFIDGSGHAKSTHPVFQIRYKNRSTFWRYLSRSTGDVMSTETQPLPLTHFGNAGTKQKPSESLVKPVNSNSKINQLVSEIYA